MYLSKVEIDYYCGVISAMDLDEFVSSTLLALARGVDLSNKALASPAFKLVSDESGLIQFDVSVAVDKSEDDQVTGKLRVLSLGIFDAAGEAKAGSAHKDSAIHRVSFSIRPSEQFFYFNDKG